MDLCNDLRGALHKHCISKVRCCNTTGVEHIRKTSTNSVNKAILCQITHYIVVIHAVVYLNSNYIIG